MSDTTADAPSADITGRPGAGAVLAAEIDAGKGRRGKSRDVRPLRRLLPFIAQYKTDTAFAAFFLILSTISTLSLTGAARLVTDHGFAKSSSAEINKYFLLAIGVAIALAVASAMRFYFVTKLGQRVVAALRTEIYNHVLKLDPTFFLKTRTGEVLSRMTTDIAIVETLVGSSASIALRNGLMMIGAITLLMITSPKLTLGVLVLVPVVMAPLFLFGRRVRKLSAAAQDRFAEAVGFAGETLEQLDTVQAFGRERFAVGKFSGAVNLALTAALTRVKARSLMTGFVIVFVFGGVAVVMWLGAHDVVTGAMSGGALVQFLILSVMGATAVGAIGEVWGDVQTAAGAMQRIDEILDSQPSVRAPPSPKALPTPARGEVRFEGVTFAYPGRPDLAALSGFDLNVRSGETVALVGPSGAGKSTVFKLLLRFYDPDAGLVSIDGVDLRDADPVEVRSRLALVAQDAGLFSGSALENIGFGREGASDVDLRAAAAAAQAQGFLEALPQGFETTLGDRGRSLSGGQRQRLAIARALVRDAPILLLDEATSALDAENEQLVQRALNEAMKGRTTLVIAHRLATVLKADRIVVMDGGKVVEQGKHDELAARGGLYARLASLQFGERAA